MKTLKTVQTYTIEINEYQRNLLASALTYATSRAGIELKALPGDSIPIVENGTAYDEVHSIINMLVDLPVVELEYPGGVHGFCL